jgi:hypothetical protein
MNKRALTLGLLIAILVSVISQALLYGQKAIATDVALYTPTFLSPFFTILIQATSMLAWAIPGICVGYLCKNKPARHGAILGSTYGALLGVALLTTQASELSNIDSQLIIATAALTQIAKYAVLFALAAPAGYLLSKHRANL